VGTPVRDQRPEDSADTNRFEVFKRELGPEDIAEGGHTTLALSGDAVVDYSRRTSSRAGNR